jgi:hypothetical protein
VARTSVLALACFLALASPAAGAWVLGALSPPLGVLDPPPPGVVPLPPGEGSEGSGSWYWSSPALCANAVAGTASRRAERHAASSRRAVIGRG